MTPAKRAAQVMQRSYGTIFDCLVMAFTRIDELEAEIDELRKRIVARLPKTEEE